MIIDQFGVFFDDKAAAASLTSNVVNVSPYAGRGDAAYISFLAKGANAAAVTYTVNVQESKNNATFATVGSFTLSKPNAAPVLKAIRLPVEVKEQYVRLTVTASGTPAGTVFAAVTRDHFAPYAEGQYIDGGKVVA